MSEKAKNILEKIQQEKIKPRARYFFVLRDLIVWGLFVLATMVGALAVSVIIFILIDNDWDIYKHLQKSFWGYVFVSLPYFWFLILLALLGAAYWNYRHTRKGYLLNPYVLFLASFFFSLLLGWVLFVGGAGEGLDRFFGQRINYYSGAEAHKIETWSNPESGLLAGKIIEIREGYFLLNDFNLQKWKIVEGETIWKRGAQKEIGESVKVIGNIEGEDIFRAEEIRPWQGGRGNLKKGSAGEGAGYHQSGQGRNR
ncbi:MAG: hypothetical protein V3574_03900 [Candidatus Moraniibacteriota bacterium]